MCPPLLPSLSAQMLGREALLSSGSRLLSEADILSKFAAETDLEFKGGEVAIL